MTPGGRISMPEFHVPKSTNQLAIHQKSQEDYNLQQLGYANKSIPHFRKIPGGEDAYEQALIKKGSQTKRPQTSNRMQSNRTDFQTINQQISRNVGLFNSSHYVKQTLKWKMIFWFSKASQRHLRCNLHRNRCRDLHRDMCRDTVPKNSYRFWADLLLTQIVISRVWLTLMNISKMPCLSIILIIFSWPTSHNFFILKKSKFT